MLRRALPGVVWPPPPRVYGLQAAAAASGPGGRSDVTTMAGIKGGPGALSPGGLGCRSERGDGGPTRGPHAVSRDPARAAGLPALAADSRLPPTATPASDLRPPGRGGRGGLPERTGQGPRLPRQPSPGAELGRLAPSRRPPVRRIEVAPPGVRSPAASRSAPHTRVLQEFAAEGFALCGFEGVEEAARDASYGKSVSFPI